MFLARGKDAGEEHDAGTTRGLLAFHDRERFHLEVDVVVA
jgi:hypothetical protein